MGISKQTMPASAFDGDLQKQGSKSLKLSTKNLVFVAFAIIILQVADAGLQWLVGGSTSQHDTFMYATVVFIISKCIYTKYLNDAKVRAEKTNEDEVSEEVQTEEQPATMVVDTLKTRIRTFKSTKAFAPRAAKPAAKSETPSGEKENWVPTWLKDSVPQRLNAKAKKFVPVGPSNTLDSEAPLFLPTAQQVEEYQLLKSEYGGLDTGAVVYRSRHWLQEIRSDTKKSTPTQIKSKSPEIRKKKVPELAPAQKAPELVPAQKVPELVPAQKVRRGSQSPEPAPKKKKWQEKVNPKDIKWASAWSTFQTACTL